jgi:toxin-antitoxin system PIN domain toxin
LIAVDTNILVYAHREDSPWHAAALEAMRELAEGTRPWAIPWPAVHEFISVVTHPRIYQPPSALEAALDSISVWLSSPSCRTLGEGPSYFEAFRKLALSAKISGPMAHDARIAALCLDNGVTELWTADRNFSRFGALKCRNPLV